MGNRRVTTKDIYAKKTSPLTVPVRPIDGLESIACGFRAQLVEVDIGGRPMGGVYAGAGLGNDHIIVDWKGQSLLIRGTELLIAWLKIIDPTAAKEMIGEMGGLKGGISVAAASIEADDLTNTKTTVELKPKKER